MDKVSGAICQDVFEKDWSPVLDISQGLFCFLDFLNNSRVVFVYYLEVLFRLLLHSNILRCTFLLVLTRLHQILAKPIDGSQSLCLLVSISACGLNIFMLRGTSRC